MAVLSEGDPLFYGSYMHLHVRLAHRFPTEVIPGVTAMSGCWSATGMPIVQGDDVLSVLPGTMAEAELTRRLADTDAAVIMKVGRNLPKIRRALDTAGKLQQAVYVERGTMDNAASMRLADKPDDDRALFRAGAGARLGEPAVSGRLAVIGLGPGSADQVTPEAAEAVRTAREFFGYKPYLDRLNLVDGQIRHASDNREELSRASAALMRAGRGHRRRRGFRRRPRRVRHGGGSVRGDRGRAAGMARHRAHGGARRHRDAGGRRPHRRAARP